MKLMEEELGMRPPCSAPENIRFERVNDSFEIPTIFSVFLVICFAREPIINGANAVYILWEGDWNTKLLHDLWKV